MGRRRAPHKQPSNQDNYKLGEHVFSSKDNWEDHIEGSHYKDGWGGQVWGPKEGLSLGDEFRADLEENYKPELDWMIQEDWRGKREQADPMQQPEIGREMTSLMSTTVEDDEEGENLEFSSPQAKRRKKGLWKLVKEGRFKKKKFNSTPESQVSSSTRFYNLSITTKAFEAFASATPLMTMIKGPPSDLKRPLNAMNNVDWTELTRWASSKPASDLGTRPPTAKKTNYPGTSYSKSTQLVPPSPTPLLPKVALHSTSQALGTSPSRPSSFSTQRTSLKLPWETPTPQTGTSRETIDEMLDPSQGLYWKSMSESPGGGSALQSKINRSSTNRPVREESVNTPALNSFHSPTSSAYPSPLPDQLLDFTSATGSHENTTLSSEQWPSSSTPSSSFLYEPTTPAQDPLREFFRELDSIDQAHKKLYQKPQKIFGVGKGTRRGKYKSSIHRLEDMKLHPPPTLTSKEEEEGEDLNEIELYPGTGEFKENEVQTGRKLRRHFRHPRWKSKDFYFRKKHRYDYSDYAPEMERFSRRREPWEALEGSNYDDIAPYFLPRGADGRNRRHHRLSSNSRGVIGNKSHLYKRSNLEDLRQIETNNIISDVEASHRDLNEDTRDRLKLDSSFWSKKDHFDIPISLDSPVEEPVSNFMSKLHDTDKARLTHFLRTGRDSNKMNIRVNPSLDSRLIETTTHLQPKPIKQFYDKPTVNQDFNDTFEIEARAKRGNQSRELTDPNDELNDLDAEEYESDDSDLSVDYSAQPLSKSSSRKYPTERTDLSPESSYKRNDPHSEELTNNLYSTKATYDDLSSLIEEQEYADALEGNLAREIVSQIIREAGDVERWGELGLTTSEFFEASKLIHTPKALMNHKGDKTVQKLGDSDGKCESLDPDLANFLSWILEGTDQKLSNYESEPLSPNYFGLSPQLPELNLLFGTLPVDTYFYDPVEKKISPRQLNEETRLPSMVDVEAFLRQQADFRTDVSDGRRRERSLIQSASAHRPVLIQASNSTYSKP